MLAEILKHLENENFYWNLGFYSLVLAGFAHLIFLFLFYYLDIMMLVYANIISVSIYIYSIFGLGLQTLETKDDAKIGWLVYFELIGHGCLATYYLGIESGFIYYIYALVIIPFFLFSYTKLIRFLRLLGVIVVIMILEFWGYHNAPIVILNDEYITIFHYMNLTIVLIMLSGISYYFTTSANMYQKVLYEQSHIDTLTSVYNRRYIDTLLDDQKAFLRNRDTQYALLLIDVDFFKNINDTYGHKCGDKVLIGLTEILQTHLRHNTTISRWGGEEFLIIVERTTRDALIVLSERLRGVVEEHILENNIRITITLGGALSQSGETFDQVLARADKSLYKGKENGRNQVVIFS